MRSFKKHSEIISVWENYRAMRNAKQDKPESEMSYDEKRKKRMNDPKRGINSPAFKKFMASQGMQVTQFKIV